MNSTHWIIKYRLTIILLFSGITILSLLLFPKLKINSDLDSYMPKGTDNQQHLRKLDSIFGGSEMILLMFQTEEVLNSSTLKRVQSISEELSDLKGVGRCISAFDAQDISIEDGFMKMVPLLDEIPETEEEFKELKIKISTNKMASRFFDSDFSVASIIVIKESDISDKLLIEEIKSIIQKNPGSEKVLIGGQPFIRYAISGNIKKDIVYLLPIALVLMILVLFFAFREWKGVYLPFLIVIMSMILSFGVMALLGWQISLITILLPIMLIAIANDYGIHMMARYQELVQNNQQKPMVEICQQIYNDLKRPIIITALTTIGGVLGLLTHTMIPAAQLGVLTAIGIAFSLLLSIWFLPALLSYHKPISFNRLNKSSKKSTTNKWLNKFSYLVTNFPKRVIVVSGLIGILGFFGLFLLRVDTNIEGYFLGNSEVSQSIELINNKFGGAQYVSVLFKGDVLSPVFLNRIENYEKELLDDPAVGTVSSPITLIKELSKGFYTKNERGYNQIPATEDEVFQFIEIFTMGGNEEVVEQFIDYNYEYSRMLISLKDGSNSEGKRLLKKLQELMQNEPNLEFIAGTIFTKITLADMVVKGQIKSLILAIFVVFVILSIIFKTYKAGVLSALPL
ncbi:MAG: MMPL family transporter, partial [Draconibacterium sp.]|nr:MMPL family transporter [Draconibacterium sp.]